MRRAWITAAFCVVCSLSAVLSGCGSAAGQEDTYKQECIDNGGSYIDYETDGDACVYGDASLTVTP